MTDRDQFAAAALTGLIGWKRGDDTPSSSTDLARWAYGLANAMLRESDRTYEKNDEKRCDSDMGWATLTDRELDLILFASNMIERDVADVCDGKVGADARRYVRGLRKLWARFTTHHAKEKKA